MNIHRRIGSAICLAWHGKPPEEDLELELQNNKILLMQTRGAVLPVRQSTNSSCDEGIAEFQILRRLCSSLALEEHVYIYR